MSGGPERRKCRTKGSELRRIRATNPNFGRFPRSPPPASPEPEEYAQNQMAAPDYDPWPDLERTPSVEMNPPEEAADTTETGPPAPPDSPQIGILPFYKGRRKPWVGDEIKAPNGVKGKITSVKRGEVTVEWERRSLSAPPRIG